MKRLVLTNVGIRHPWLTMWGILLVTAGFLVQFPKVTFDNDPENMLAEDEPVRLLHQRVKERYQLYDFVIVGVVNERHPDGVFNVETLGRIDDLTKELISLHPAEDGRPAVIRPARGERSEEVVVPSLRPEKLRERVLAAAFNHDPEDLFHEDGSSVIIRSEIISPTVVDNIRQAEFGQLAIEYLMEEPPATRGEALRVREDAMGNPLYRGTMVSEDGEAICLYIPIHEKMYSYNVANLVEALTEGWEKEGDEIYITGLPVAEDTFGVEMLVQMATSAPMAGLAIFLLLLMFFRRLSLVIAPMVVAIVSVICTMGLLIGLGYDVHIMSSMIAIFLMPIAVADSVHILSEFYDIYPRIRDKAKAVREAIQHLFVPMLYTSLTTIAGFASLGFTPIPPVRVFGLHVAFGVGLAWLLSMILVPAYIMLFVKERSLENLVPSTDRPARRSRLDPFLKGVGGIAFRHPKRIVAGVVVVLVVAAIGISRIEVNDNPVNWFTESHRIRVADRVLNEHFGGTYTAYLTLGAAEEMALSCADIVDPLSREAEDRFGESAPEVLAAFRQALRELEAGQDAGACFAALAERSAAIDEGGQTGWRVLADEINYLDPDGLDPASLTSAVIRLEGVDLPVKQAFMATRSEWADLNGEALLDAALGVCDERAPPSLREFVLEMQATLQAPLFKQPEMLSYIEDLQAHLAEQPLVGKSSSAVDALKKAHYELNYRSPAESGSAAEVEARNRAAYAIPSTPAAVGQVFTQLEGMKKKDSLFHLVTRDYDEVNLWIQVKSGDNKDMEAVVSAAEDYLAEHPAPVLLQHGWGGLSYLNIVWQDKMVTGMLGSLAGSFVVVLAMMIMLFRSFWFGLLAMIPLSVTIAFIYGLIGLAGKDYDMPVAILSALTLGLSVDFAIHFLQRSRELQAKHGGWKQAVGPMFQEPAKAISRNAIVISVGFTPLLFAPLVPYKTVGFFLATIMAVSWIATLLVLAALVTLGQRRLFPGTEAPAQP